MFSLIKFSNEQKLMTSEIACRRRAFYDWKIALNFALKLSSPSHRNAIVEKNIVNDFLPSGDNPFYFLAQLSP